MAKTEIIGSWHNSGFHGHFRNKSRSDFIGEYRYLAKPPPPRDFIRRSQERTTSHVFSKHDNRHSFRSDALYFEEGLGRRRLPNNINRWTPDFLTWIPQKRELEQAGPKASEYKVSYRGTPVQPMKEQIIKRPKTSFDDDRINTTSYRYAHGNGNPNKEILSAMNNEALRAIPQRRAKTPSPFKGDGRESVATCLNWYTPKAARNTPAATAITFGTEGHKPVETKKTSQTVPVTASEPMTVAQ